MNIAQDFKNSHRTDPIQQLALIFARGYIRLLKRQSAESPSVKEWGFSPHLDVPTNQSLHYPAVNKTAHANPNRKGGRK